MTAPTPTETADRALREAMDPNVEAGCIAVYGKNWDGPDEKRPGEAMKHVWRDLVAKAQAPAIAALRAENERLKGQLDETYVDEKGTVWVRPTAWAYFAACRAAHAHREANNGLRAAHDALASELGRVKAALRIAEAEMSRNIHPKPDAGPDHPWSKLLQIRAALQEPTP